MAEAATVSVLVPEAGLEPAHPRGRGILNPLRLPISPLWLRRESIAALLQDARAKKMQWAIAFGILALPFVPVQYDACG